MTGIVDDLKRYADTSSHPSTMLDAANEIERLRAALEEIKSLGVQKKGSASYAMASIARAALAQGGDE